MDQQRLSDLPAASPLSELAQVPVLQDGTGARASVAQFRAGLASAAHRHGLGDLPVAADGASDPTALVRGDDARLSDARTPLAHNHGIGDLPVAEDGAADHARLVRADDDRLSDARTPRTHAHALVDLPVAADGVADAGKLVRSDDSRLTGGSGGGGGFKNVVINGCCRVSTRSAKALSGGWQYGAVDLLAVRADGSPSAGTLTQASGVTQLAVSGTACLVQGAKLNGSGAVWWRHRLEARDAARFVNAAAVLSARTYHDAGSAVTYTLTINKANAADDFAAVTLVGSGTVSMANATNADLVLTLPNLGACGNGLEILVKAACGSVNNKSFYLADLQLETGTTRTAFERRPVAVETALVRRFLRPCVGLVAKANSATTVQVLLSHPDLRSAPVYEATAPLAFTDAVTADFTQSQASITTVHERTHHHGRVSCGFFAGLTAGAMLIQRGTGGTILASAEL